MLSTTAEYALRALLVLAKEDEGQAVLGRDLSKRSGVPANYLSKILLDVKKTGLVQAVRGTGGGYRLGRPATEIRLIDIVEPIDGTRARPGCLLAGEAACSDDDAVATPLLQSFALTGSSRLGLISETEGRLP